MGIAIDATTPAFVAKVNSFGTTNTTASFTPPSGSLLVACAMDPNGGGDALTISDNLATHLNWTSLISVTGTGVIQIWVADVVTSAAMTATATVSNNRADWGFGVIVVTGALPVSGQKGATVQTANTTSVPTATIGSLVGSNSLVVGAICDVTSATAPTVGTGQSLTFNGHSFSAQDSTNLTGEWVQYLTGINLSAGSSATINDTAPTADTNKVAVVEILAVPPPTVTSVSPSSGSTAGGTPVIIGGQFFTGATAVKFGSTNAASFTVVDDAHILATSPSGSLGTVNVTVTNAVGTSSTSSADDFTYATADTLPAEYGGITFGGWYYASVPVTSSGPTNYTQNFTAALSFAGASGKQTVKTPFTASLSFAGAITKRTAKTLTAGASFAGALLKATSKHLAAGLSFTGALLKAIVHQLAAALSFAGLITKNTVKSAFTAGLSFAGAFSKGLAHILTFTASLSFAGSLQRSTTKTLTAGLSFAGAFAKATVKQLSAGLSFAGSLIKAIVKTAFTAGLSFSGAFAKGQAHLLTFTASLSFSGAFSKATTKALTAGVSFAGAIKRATTKSLGATLSFAGSVRKSIAKKLSGALSFVGRLTTSGGTPTTPPTVCYPTSALIVPYASASAIVPYASAPAFRSYSSSTTIRSWSTTSTGYSYGSAGSITGYSSATTIVDYTSAVTHFNTCDD